MHTYIHTHTRIYKAQARAQTCKNGSWTLSTLFVDMFVPYRLGFAMINLCDKFEVRSSFVLFKDREAQY